MKIFSQNFELVAQTKDSSNQSIVNSLNFQKKHTSKKNVLLEIDSISFKLSKKGYINNQLNITDKDSVTYCQFTLNQKVEIIRVYFTPNSIDKNLLNEIALSSTATYFTTPLNSIENSLNKIVSYYENKGHSFTNVSLTNIEEIEEVLSAHLLIRISNKRNLNNIVIKGYPEFPKKYINHFLELKKNKTFNLERLEELNQLINTIPFVTQIKKPEILFTKDSTTLYIYVKKKSNSSFDGIVGFSNETETNKLKFNGYLDLELNNILNKGEKINVNWENSQNKNSTLNLKFNSPYIFNSKFTLYTSFEIFRQDTLYVNTKGDLQIGYSINRNNNINIKGSTEKSEVTTNTISSIESFNKNLFGINYNFKIAENPIYRNINRFFIEGGYLIGTRTSQNINTQQNNINFSAYYYAHLNSRNSIFIKTKTEILNSTSKVVNELFRIGGVNSIRGFNENSILTEKYNITNIEYHYQLSNNSYLYTISDFAIINNPNTEITEQLYGLGLGFYLNTKNTTLNLSYALGKNHKSPFNFNNSKLHIRINYPF